MEEGDNRGSGGQVMTRILERNIEVLLERRKEEERNRSTPDKIAAAISKFAGSISFVIMHAVLVAAWVLVNTGLTPLPPFDPTFVILATVASVEAIFLSTFVLITQNRMSEAADKRADLDLQVSLLSEHEITQLIKMVRDIADRLNVSYDNPEELHELSQDVHPEVVLDEIEQRQSEKDAAPATTDQ